MKALFVKYKAVVKFIVTFLVVYIGGVLLYGWYLDLSDGSKFYPDYITYLVSNQTEALIHAFGYKVQMVPDSLDPSIKILINERHIGAIAEGCNGVSVIILFMAFIISFSRGFKTTILFILSGSVMLYTVNLIRILILSLALYHYPQHQHVLHTIVFPAIIYGMVFLLWLFWVNSFPKLSKND